MSRGIFLENDDDEEEPEGVSVDYFFWVWCDDNAVVGQQVSGRDRLFIISL